MALALKTSALNWHRPSPPYPTPTTPATSGEFFTILAKVGFSPLGEKEKRRPVVKYQGLSSLGFEGEEKQLNWLWPVLGVLDLLFENR